MQFINTLSLVRVHFNATIFLFPRPYSVHQYTPIPAACDQRPWRWVLSQPMDKVTVLHNVAPAEQQNKWTKERMYQCYTSI